MKSWNQYTKDNFALVKGDYIILARKADDHYFYDCFLDELWIGGSSPRSAKKIKTLGQVKKLAAEDIKKYESKQKKKKK